MRDCIFIKNLTCQAIIGVLPEERTSKQTLNIDLDIETDTSRAALTADLALSVDYAKVAREVEELAVDAEAYLLETLAEDIAKYVLANKNAHAVTVSLDKPSAVSSTDTVGVRIYRER